MQGGFAVVMKETCPVCKGNKYVAIERKTGSKDWRPCHGCNGSGYRIKVSTGQRY
jgi:DnaJ-class molecular chaperone